jgi:hypothetical protein
LRYAAGVTFILLSGAAHGACTTGASFTALPEFVGSADATSAVTVCSAFALLRFLATCAGFRRVTFSTTSAAFRGTNLTGALDAIAVGAIGTVSLLSAGTRKAARKLNLRNAGGSARGTG